MTNSDIDALPWYDAAIPAPEGQPVLAEFHAWNDPKRDVMRHVVWWFRGQWCSYPSTEDVAYVDRWQPLPGSADMTATILALRDQLAKAEALLDMSAFRMQMLVNRMPPDEDGKTSKALAQGYVDEARTYFAAQEPTP